MTMPPNYNIINQNAHLIVENIAYESVAVYLFLRDEYARGNIITNHVFQFVYRSFYRIDYAGLTDNFKNEYFRLLESHREGNNVDLRQLVRQLNDIPNHRGDRTIQFSFVTKLANTVNENFPIYDSNVAYVYGFRRPLSNKPFDSRLDEFMNQYDELRNSYSEIIDGRLLEEALEVFRGRFGQQMHVVKKIDFIMWSCGNLRMR